jgi:DNA-binding transcriptional LysR family regulator
VRYSVPSFLLVPELLQIEDLIALVPSRLLRGHGERLRLLRSPINVPGFDVIAVWHPRVDKDVAHRCACACRRPPVTPEPEASKSGY